MTSLARLISIRRKRKQHHPTWWERANLRWEMRGIKFDGKEWDKFGVDDTGRQWEFRPLFLVSDVMCLCQHDVTWCTPRVRDVQEQCIKSHIHNVADETAASNVIGRGTSNVAGRREIKTGVWGKGTGKGKGETAMTLVDNENSDP